MRSHSLFMALFIIVQSVCACETVLPGSSRATAINRKWPTLCVSLDSIYFNDNCLGAVGQLPDSLQYAFDPVIDELKQALLTDKQASRNSRQKGINVQLHKFHSFSLLFAIINTIAHCGYEQIGLLVQTSSETGSHVITIPQKNSAARYVPNIFRGKVPGGRLTGGRAKESIAQTVTAHVLEIRQIYNEELQRNAAKGQIVVKFAIDEFGKIIFFEVISDTVGSKTMRDAIEKAMVKWDFGQIDKPGDVTEVVYPFVFSQ